LSTSAKIAETVSPSPTDLHKLPTNKKVKKEDLNVELVHHVMHTSKTGLICTRKFTEDVEEEKDVTREITPLLPVNLEIPKDKFVEQYKGIVYDGIKAGRTDVQQTARNEYKYVQHLQKYKGIGQLQIIYVNFGFPCNFC